MWMQLCRPTTRLRWDKPEKCCVLSHYFNNKTNILPIFQEHNLLSDTFFINKKRCKNKKTLKTRFYKIIKKRKKRFFTSME